MHVHSSMKDQVTRASCFHAEMKPVCLIPGLVGTISKRFNTRSAHTFERATYIIDTLFAKLMYFCS